MKEFRAEDRIIDGVKKVHMIGIGGSGMNPLAAILHSKGYILSGSDNNESDNLRRIRELGIKVYMGHNADNLADCELVVYSAAISADNPELVAARERGIPTMERSHLLGALTRRFDNVIGVSGTHGKTTVSSMLTQVLFMAGLDPSAVIGGKLPLINANGRAGESEIMVCEACEFVDTFLQMSPDISILLNIDNDHLDYFGSMENLCESFRKFVFMSRVAFVNGDDELALGVVKKYDGRVFTFGLGENNFCRAENIRPGRAGMEFTAVVGEDSIDISLNIPGGHNVYNALATIATAHYLGVGLNDIKLGVESFGGAGRRFERLGEYGGITVADDYAHHPTEIEATLKAAKQLQFNRVIAVFQPFTFSRTEALKDEFVKALSLADIAVLTPIMGSREQNTTGIDSAYITDRLQNSYLACDFADAVEYLKKTASSGDLVLTMGGGDIYKAAHMFIEKIK